MSDTEFIQQGRMWLHVPSGRSFPVISGGSEGEPVTAEAPAEPSAEPVEPSAPAEPTPAPTPPSEPGSARDYLAGLSDEELEAQGHSPNYVKQLQKENQEYREKWSPYEERFSKLGEDADQVNAFVDALANRDAATVRQMVAAWHAAFEGSQPAPQAQPEPSSPFKMEDPSQPPDLKSAIREVFEELRSESAAERDRRERAEQVRGEFTALGFDLSDPEQMAEAQAIATIADRTGRSATDVFNSRLEKLSGLLGEKKPAPRPTPSSQATPPAGSEGNRSRSKQERQVSVRDRMAQRIEQMEQDGMFAAGR